MVFISNGVDLSQLNILLIVSAFVLGTLHALEPGHGKSVMAAFVMGTNANIKDSVLLGLTVVFSHVVVVIALGFIAVFLLGELDLKTTHNLMSIIGGIILIIVGLWIFKKYYSQHQHNHFIDTKKGVIAIGLSTGLIPCPAALVVLLFSLSNNQLYRGIIYVLIFSAGLAISITLLSILFVKGRNFIKSYTTSKSINKITLLSGIIIMVIGFITLFESFIMQI